MSKPARKPLRRTAWSMFLGGVVVTAVMLGVGVLAVSRGEQAGPGQVARWPAGSEIGVFRAAGGQPGGSQEFSVVCVVTTSEGATERSVGWGDRLTPDFTGDATVTCERSARVVAGSALTVAGVVRGPLVALPMFVAVLGVLLFVPRFTRVWASLTQPIGGWITRRFERR